VPDVLRPLFDQVVIKELEPERMRKSGLLVPQGTHDLPPNEGIVLAVGDGPPDLIRLPNPCVPRNKRVSDRISRQTPLLDSPHERTGRSEGYRVARRSCR